MQASRIVYKKKTKKQIYSTMSFSSGFHTRTIQREHITNFCLRTCTVLASTVEKKPSFAMKLDLKVMCLKFC